MIAEAFPMAAEKKKSFFRAFWDFFVLFSGISTASNLERTQGRPLRHSGLFLLRRPIKPAPDQRTTKDESPGSR
jgi:hypothetical protein